MTVHRQRAFAAAALLLSLAGCTSGDRLDRILAYEAKRIAASEAGWDETVLFAYFSDRIGDDGTVHRAICTAIGKTGKKKPPAHYVAPDLGRPAYRISGQWYYLDGSWSKTCGHPVMKPDGSRWVFEKWNYRFSEDRLRYESLVATGQGRPDKSTAPATT